MNDHITPMTSAELQAFCDRHFQIPPGKFGWRHDAPIQNVALE